jgi:hypothetical protein
MVIDRMIFEGLLEEDLDIMIDKALEILKERYDVISDYSGSQEMTHKDIMLIKK